MTITCPACDTRFRSPPADIELDRPVQCGKCEHEWVRDCSAATSEINLDGPSVVAETKSRGLLGDLTSGEDLIETALEVVMPGEEVGPSKSTKALYVDRVPEEKPKAPSIMLPMIGMACAALFAGSIVFKDAIIAQAPTTKEMYQSVGLITANPGLTIKNVVTSKINNDGIRQLIVRGEVQNTADATVPVPALKLIMRGQKNADLYNWNVTTAKAQLKAGEISRFSAVAYNFPDEAVNVEVEFIPLDKKSKEE